MASLAFLITDLQSLASETRRRHPEIREAAEKSLAILKSSPEQATIHLASDGPQSDELLKPVLMGCATKNAKVVGISLGSLQRLIALKAVPQRLIPLIISNMADAVSQGVDIQLRILQTLLSLITNFPAVHGTLLGDALLLCFRLQESRIAVVSSTAAATLRQLVMFVVDKMIEEDRLGDINTLDLSKVQLPDGTTKTLGPSAWDAFSVFEDLCLLANSEQPHFLKLEYLHKTFALELIESVLTNYHESFRKHLELLLLLQLHLCPLLLKALSERPLFPLTLRCTRVVFLLLKQFSAELVVEEEVFLVVLIKMINEENDGITSPGETSNHVVRPPWMRVLALEIIRGLCADAELVRHFWDRYDAQAAGSNIVTPLITALKRLVTEKPAILGVSSQIHGVGVLSHTGEGYGLDVGGVAGMVATAASATVSGVVGMMASGAGLSLQSSAMKLQCIDQLDKADSPPIPESYVYLLGVQCIVSICDGFSSFTGALYTSIVMQKPRSAGDPASLAPPAFDLSLLPQEDPSTKHLLIVRDMIESGWPALLAALSFVISTNLSDELFVDVLASYQAMTNTSGILALSTPRDAFFASLAKFAIPSRVVSSLDSYGEPVTPRTTASFSENLGLSAPYQPPGLSERNMACLKVFLSCALFLAGSLGENWYGILETLQNADYVLTSKGVNSPANRRNSYAPGTSGTATSRSASIPVSASTTVTQTQGLRHPLLTDLDADSLQATMQHLFESSKSLEDQAFKDFLDALCRLSSEMVGMQSDSAPLQTMASDSSEDFGSSASLAPRTEPAHRRRVSGIHLPRTLRSGDFGINKLGNVVLLNVHRLIYRSPEIAWTTTTKHLLSIIRLHTAPHVIRVQAARVLDEILVIVPRNLTTASDLQAPVQRRVLDVLAQQIIPDNASNVNTGVTIELRRMGLETLHQILQSSGHTLVIGWETIFEMLGSVCKPATPFRSSSLDSISLLGAASPPVSKPKLMIAGLGTPSERGYTTLIKIAFQSLTLVCDSISLLSPEHLRLCISTLGQFGRQADTNIALTAAESLLWSVSDSIQYKRKDVDKEPEYSVLWMFLLQEVLGLCADTRPEVRVGAIQTLFRAMQLYGATLSLEMWEECMWKVTFPLLQSITAEIRHYAHTASPITAPTVSSLTLTVAETSESSPEQAWSESKILALQSIGSIMHEFLVVKVMRLDSFTKIWDMFVTNIQDAVLLDHRSVSTPALRCLEKAVKASSLAGFDLKPRVLEASERVWKSCEHIGDGILQKFPPMSPVGSPVEENGPSQPFSQESLVALVDVIRCTRELCRTLDGLEWQLDRLTRLVGILKGILTYHSSTDYRPDVDALTPVQSIVLDTLAGLDLSGPGSSSLVIRDLAECITLPFLAAFDVRIPSSTPKAAQKRVTYIALSKKAMPRVVELYLQFKSDAVIYIDGTLETVINAFSIPIKLKYDCPPPSKFGKDPPLWKTATNCFLQIVRECTLQMDHFGEDVPSDRVEGILTRMMDVFRGGILADCSNAESFSLDEQDAEENFDRALLKALETSVVPYLGDERLPDTLVSHLGRILHQGSRLYHQHSPLDDTRGILPATLGTNHPNHVNGNSIHASGMAVPQFSIRSTEYDLGSTDSGAVVPRERFSYWCFDLLFLICSEHTELSRRRLATLNLASLLNRCRTTLVGYVADESIRGNLPFSRVREEELLYVLRKLLELRLSPDSFWAAKSTHSPDSSSIVAQAVQRSAIAHLFHFYPLLCRIASIPRKSPSTWLNAHSANGSAKPNAEVAPGIIGPGMSDTDVVEADARDLARECLMVIGKEMGVGC